MSAESYVIEEGLVNQPTFQHSFDEDDSVTVPSGEVWWAWVNVGGGQWHNTASTNYIIVNDSGYIGMSQGNSNRSGWSYGTRTFFVGGDELVMSSNNDEDQAFISGFEVSDFIQNDAISMQLTDGESTTVPSEEVWSVVLASGIDKPDGESSNQYVELVVDDEYVYTAGRNTDERIRGQPVKMYLDGGAQLDFHTNSNTGGIHIGGYVL